MADTNRPSHIVVLGAGYSGMLAAITAARRLRGPAARRAGAVTLVNPSTRFTERLRMHQIATGQQLADFQIPDVLAGTGVEFVQGWATGIDPAERRVVVATGEGERILPYDRLVYAIGSTADTITVPGAAEHAFTLDDPEHAGRLAARLAEIAPTGGTVAVCGGGLTGLEAATEIAESFPGVRVVMLSRTPPASTMGDKARAYVMRALERLGVEVRAGVEITKVLPGGVELAGGESLSFDAVLWTTGMRAAPLAAGAGIATDEHGRIVVDATLRSVSHPSIYAIGDAAAVRQAYGVIHGTCQSGIPMGAHAGASVAGEVRGGRPRPFRFGYLHQPVSLGRSDAVIQFTHPDDTPRRWFLSGRSAMIYKELVSGSPMTTYKLAKRIPVPAAVLAGKGGRRNRVQA
ncbi:NAD(P)/FAD-dependent oxidoreductase [Microbispora sp. NPDC049125]|uniref:NAD(P)/FAD-dependent oxidoreductase n=1 Tax=Microbispora sp. NPDC049125 TaxID=3154929 RepID=UPI0034652871